MGNNLTPVEALQRELDAFRAKKQLLKGDPARAGITIAVPLYEALLELAKADATRTLGHTYTCPCVHCELVVSARIKLNEALQR